MAWKCKKCGSKVIAVKTDKNIMDENRNFIEQYSEDYWYECTSCDNFSYYLEDIAEWEED